MSTAQDQGRFRRGIRRVALDVTPLRTARDFRLLWLGELVSVTGSQISLVAVFVQVYALTHSSAAVGLVGLCQLVPLVLFTIFGGPIIDSHDRRRLLIGATLLQSGTSSLLLVGALIGHPPLALVYVAAGLAEGSAASRYRFGPRCSRTSWSPASFPSPSP